MSGLHLHGHQLDAIIFRTRPRRRFRALQRFLDRIPLLDRYRPLKVYPVLPLAPPAEDARFDRYMQARQWVDPVGWELFALRRDIGLQFKAAWSRGQWPKLGKRAMRYLMDGVRS